MTDEVSAATVEITNPTAVTTDHGQIEYIAFSGDLTYRWDDLQSDVTHGRAVLSSTLKRDGTELATKNWQEETFQVSEGMSQLTRYGNLESPVDFSSIPAGGEYTFKSYGEDATAGTNPRPICVIAENGWVSNTSPTENGYISEGDYDNPSSDIPLGGYLVVDDPFSTDYFEQPDNGESQTTTVELTFTGEVYNGDPTGSNATRLSDPATASGSFEVGVTNKVTAGTAIISGEGVIGANESDTVV